MHKNIEVVRLTLDGATGSINWVGPVREPAHVPVGIPIAGRSIDRKALNDWWLGRAIPASRSGLREALEEMKVQNVPVLLEKCLGLSLSDHYWIRPADSDLTWQRVNFFENSFSEDVGNILFGQNLGEKNIDLMSPDNTSDGALKKKWTVMNGRRVMVKGGSGATQQEPYNEVFASRIMERLGISHVQYSLWIHEGYPYCICENFLSPNTELISAWYVLQTAEKKNDVSLYDHYLDCCQRLGVGDIRPALDQMLTVDYLIANEDRHLNNFGVIRNADTLEFLGSAPVFDSGCSLWYNSPISRIDLHIKNPDQNPLKCRPFRGKHKDQIKLVSDFNWLDFSLLKGIEDEFYEIVKDSEFIDVSRRDAICRGIAGRVKALENIVMSQRAHIFFGAGRC